LHLVRSNARRDALDLLGNLHEPNETRLGFSSSHPRGRGVGALQASSLFDSLFKSTAVRERLVEHISECELMIENIGPDKVSDITTNIIRHQLVLYTQSQCNLLGIRSLVRVPLSAVYDANRHFWTSGYYDLPTYGSKPILFVPKLFVRYRPAIFSEDFYEQCVLDFLKAEHLTAMDSLVHFFKNGKRTVFKTKLRELYTKTKEFLTSFIRSHKKLYEEYKRNSIIKSRRELKDFLNQQPLTILAREMIEALKEIRPGMASATTYHRFMIGAIELIFFPLLSNPIKEVEILRGRKRIDILTDNTATYGRLAQFSGHPGISSTIVPIECKNYSSDIANPELDQLIGRDRKSVV
jgi:arsenate reductase-like glutaredoxin family protein